MKLMLAGLLVGLLVCASEAEAQTAKTTSGCRSDFFAHATGHREIARAVARLEQEMRTRNIPGLQAAVVKQGQIVMLVSCGTADISFELPVVRTTRFQLASATKPFTGVAIMQLVEEGKIRLDNRLADYLENLPESWRSVTVRQALMHVSGLPDVIDPATGAVIDPAGFSAAWTKVLSAPMQFSPGRAYAYDQTNYLLLGRIIEKLRGEPFVEGVRRRQFAVADMPSATFSDAYSIVPGRATSYALRQMVDGVLTPRDTPQPNVFSYPKSLYTGAGVTASSEEVARWLIALRNDKLLSADKRKEMWTAGRMPDGAPTAWALGWPAFPREKHPAVAGIGGGSAAFYFYPEDDVGIVILTNLGGAQPQQFIEQVAEYYGSDPPA